MQLALSSFILNCLSYLLIIFRFQNIHQFKMKHNPHENARPTQSFQRSPEKYGNQQDGHSRNYLPLEDSGERLRQTITKVVESVQELRKSYCVKPIKIESKDFRMSSMAGLKKNTTSLKTQMDSLQEKVQMARSQLIQRSFSKKKTVPFQYPFIDQRQEQFPKKGTTDSSITIKNSQRKINELTSIMPKPKSFKPSYTNPYSPRRHNIYYISEAVRAKNEKNSLAVEHISASINMIKMCEEEGVLESSQIEKYKLNLPRRQFYRNKKTLVLDLDQTLIHCVGNYQVQSDFQIAIKIEGQQLSIGFNIRPHAMTFLKKMAEKFQIIIFTAGHQTYADAILDVLDPDQQIFAHRLYRQHCFLLNRDEIYVKDLRIINRDLSEMVLVDNSAYSYAFQLENGIPILPFYYGADFEFVALEKYLQEIEKAQDVREVNKKTFKLHHYTKFDNAEELIEQLYMNNLQ